MQPTLPEFDLDRYLPFRMTVIAGQLSDNLARQYKSTYGISMPEWRVLLNVGYSKQASVRDIEKRVNLEKSKVSRAASKLQAKGYLEKQIDDRDRRLLKLTLTENGVHLLNELIPIALRFQAKLETRMGDEFAVLNAALDRLSGEEE